MDDIKIPDKNPPIVNFPDLVRKIARITLINIRKIEFVITGFGSFEHICYYTPDSDGNKDEDMKQAESIIYILSNLKICQLYSVCIDNMTLVIRLNIVNTKTAKDIQDKLDEINADGSFFI